jgi:hypothetical protein
VQESRRHNATFYMFTAVKINAEVFFVVTSCSFAVGY